MDNFYKNYVRLCESKKETLTAVALNIGLSNAAPTGWKNGKKPSARTLQRLSSYFGVSVDELTGEQKEKPSTSEDVELSKEDAELVDLILKASPEKKDAIRMLLR